MASGGGQVQRHPWGVGAAVNGFKFRRRAASVQARRFNNGIFTKREWLEWCPEAQIACAGRSVEETLDSRNFGWFCIGPHEVFEGDWVVREKSGEFSVCSPGAFEQEFEPAYG